MTRRFRLTSCALQMNIAGMARKFLALLLMISWFGLAGFDVLEDLDLPDRFELYSSSAARSHDHGQDARPTDDFIDAAGHSRLRYFRFMEQRAAQLLIGAPTQWQKIYKLHKLHHAFNLIYLSFNSLEFWNWTVTHCK